VTELVPWSGERGRGGGAPAGLIYEVQHIGDFQEVQSRPGAFTEVPDPLGSGETVFRAEVLNTDVAPITPTENPRGQLITPTLWYPGAGYWISTKVLFPAGFPVLPEAGAPFCQWLQIYGPPFEATPPFQLKVQREEGFEYHFWQRNNSYGFDIPWMYQAPLRRGVWEEVLIHFVLEKGGSGSVELWWNGEQVTFFTGEYSYNPFGHEPGKRLVMETEDAYSGRSRLYSGNYRKIGMLESTVTYHGKIKVGLTRESVE
jgi:polysaccharide lyase-like protein